MADEDVSHGLGSNRQEMGAGLPLDAIDLDELEIGLVDQSGGPERVTAALDRSLRRAMRRSSA